MTSYYFFIGYNKISSYGSLLSIVSSILFLITIRNILVNRVGNMTTSNEEYFDGLTGAYSHRGTERDGKYESVCTERNSWSALIL